MGVDVVADGLLRVASSGTCLWLNAFCPEPPKLFDQPGGHIFFWMLAFSNIFVVLLLVSTVGGFAMRMADPTSSLARTLNDPAQVEYANLQREILGRKPLTVLLPCYLPNEEPILIETITHLVERLEYEYPFQLIVCYNTPVPMEFEEQLQKMDGRVYANGRSLRVLRVDGSRSKAENLNAALELVETEHVALYDADHHPDAHSLLIATAHMAARNVACVQGSTYLRQRPNLLAEYINAEFFVTHFVFFPAMQFLAGMGVFGGSNALWRTDALKAYQFRHDVQTEDIEMSTRAILSGKVQTYCHPCPCLCPCPTLPSSSFAASCTSPALPVPVPLTLSGPPLPSRCRSPSAPLAARASYRRPPFTGSTGSGCAGRSAGTR